MSKASKRCIADLNILKQYNAIPITNSNDNDTKDEETNKNINVNSNIMVGGDVIGISISNWDIKTLSSTIGNEGEMDALTSQLQDIANDDSTTHNESTKAMTKTQSRIRRRRRLCIPEIVFLNAFVHLKYNGQNNNDNDNKNEIIDIILNANDALGEWAACHSYLGLDNNNDGTDDTNINTNTNHNTNHAFRGVSVIKSIDAKLWSDRHEQQKKRANASNSGVRANINSNTITSASASASASSNASNKMSTSENMNASSSVGSSTIGCFGQNAISTTTEFNYDWTFSTPYTGTTRCTSASTKQQLKWKTAPKSLIDISLLTDQTQSILYFDDINLYEDDMHDNGYVSLRCKLRVMPTCFFILMTLFVRVDHVLLRVKEVRTFCKFPLDDDGNNNNDKQTKTDKSKYRICRDVTWKECKWDQLNKYELPNFVGSWRIEDENGGTGQATQQRIHGLLRRLPLIDLPCDIPKHSYLDV